MQKQVWYALALIFFLAMGVWAASVFFLPRLSSTVSTGLVIFFAALVAVSNVLANFKDIVELFRSLSKQSNQAGKKPQSKAKLKSGDTTVITDALQEAKIDVSRDYHIVSRLSGNMCLDVYGSVAVDKTVIQLGNCILDKRKHSC